MRVLAPAKINLHLRVGSLRADGFHPLLSWFCTIGLFDTLTFAAAAPVGEDGRGGDFLTLRANRPELPVDERNLIVRAAAALADTRGGTHVPVPARRERVSAVLDKQIPTGGGLGGGSSDAAATLGALNHLWNCGLDRAKLADIGSTLGSDVPFFFYAPSAVCSGRGEVVKPIVQPKPSAVVLLLPGIHVPTPAVYRKFDEMRLGSQVGLVEAEPDWREWSELPATQLLPRLVNDLETPAFAIRPELRELREKAEQLVSRPVRMSGSGSSLFTLYDDPAEAQEAAQRIQKDCRVDTRSVVLAPAIA